MESLIIAILVIPIVAIIALNSYKGKVDKEYREKETELYERERKRSYEFLQERQQLHQENEARKEQYARDLNALEERERAFKEIVAEKTRGFPWLADKVSLFHAAYLASLEDYLKNKPNPAIKGAEAVKIAKDRVREYERKYIIAQGLLDYYESLVPWLPDLQEAPDEIIIKTKTEDRDYNDDRAHEYLTVSEWNSLSNRDKFQYALDRYWSRNKSRWEIGRLYERFIGYLYESDHWDVTYFGAIKGLEDIGRDLIAKKGTEVRIIQCKNWAADKLIHEKHILQLYGTCILYELENRSLVYNIRGIFVSSCSLSDMAKQCADRLGIEIIENKRLERFPSIKCVHRDGEAIYHLPFDQQYDRIKMKLSKGDFYCNTVSEAEKSGYRRAFRWKGNS